MMAGACSYAKNLLNAGDWMAKIDLQDSYPVVPMVQEDIHTPMENTPTGSTTCHSDCHQLYQDHKTSGGEPSGSNLI